MRFVAILAIAMLGLACGEQQPGDQATDSTVVETPVIDSTVVPPVDTTVVPPVDTTIVPPVDTTVVDSAVVQPVTTS